MLDPVPEGTRMTLEEWAALPDEVPGELVAGRLVEEEMPRPVHEAVVAWLIRMIGVWCTPLGGVVFSSGAKFAVAPETGRKPDLTLYLPGSRCPHGDDALVRSPPTLAVEVVSSRPRDMRRDRVEKLDEYATFRIPWYWIVDPRHRTLEVFQLQEDGRYVRALGAATGSDLAIPGCDGLTLDLDALWALVERLEGELPEGAEDA